MNQAFEPACTPIPPPREAPPGGAGPMKTDMHPKS